MYHSVLNIFVKTVWVGPDDGSLFGFSYEEPNWPVIILFSLGIIAAIIAISVVLYRIWRKKNCHPIYFAGKVRYARHGASIRDACTLDALGESWLCKRTNEISSQGKVIGLYIDAALTIPLDSGQKVTAPIHVYPKFQK